MSMSTVKKSTPGEALWQEFLDKSSSKSEQNAPFKCPWLNGEYTEITDFEEMLRFKKHAGHVMIWCPAEETDLMLGEYPLNYRILMQIRFDGKLGFPGGLIDEMESLNRRESDFERFMDVIRKGCIREVEEEIRLSLMNPPKYVFTSCSSELRKEYENPDLGIIPGYAMHFFSCKVSKLELESVEKSLLPILSSDEVLGLTRVPLYFMSDNIRGLPAFLTNAYAGNALEQLMKTCLYEGFLTEEEVRFAYYAASKILATKK